MCWGKRPQKGDCSEGEGRTHSRGGLQYKGVVGYSQPAVEGEGNMTVGDVAPVAGWVKAEAAVRGAGGTGEKHPAVDTRVAGER